MGKHWYTNKAFLIICALLVVFALFVTGLVLINNGNSNIKYIWNSACVPTGDPTSVSTLVSPIPQKLIDNVKAMGLNVQSMDTVINNGLLYVDCKISDPELINLSENLENILGTDNYALLCQKVTLPGQDQPICLISVLKDFTGTSDWTPKKINNVYQKIFLSNKAYAIQSGIPSVITC